MNRLLEILATITTLAGLYLISENMIQGFGISAMANLIWVIYALDNERKPMIGIAVTNLLILIINLNGLGVL